MNERQDVVGALKYLGNGLSNIENLNGQRNAMIGEINKHGKEIEYEQMRLGIANRNMQTKGERSIKMQNQTKKFGRIAAIIVAILCTVFILIPICLASLVTVVAGQSNYVGSVIMSFIFIILLIVVVVWAIAKGIMGSISHKINRTIDNNAVRSLPDAQNKIISHQNQIENIKRQIVPVENQMVAEYEKIKLLMESFPPAYCYPHAVQRCAFLIENLRADTLKEALNIYEEEVFRDKVLAEQRKQTALMSITAAASVASARYAKQTANYAKQTVDYAKQTAANTAKSATYAEQAACNTADAAYYAKKVYDSLY